MAVDIKALFVQYANCILGDQRNNFRNFLYAIRDCELTRIAMPEHFIDQFCDLLQCKDATDIAPLISNKKILPMDKVYPSPPQSMRDRTPESQALFFYVALEAIYGFSGGYCEKKCPHREKRETLIGAGRFNGPDRISCYVCDQHYFVQNILQGLLDGKEYSEIDNFNLFTGMNNERTGLHMVINPSEMYENYKGHFKEILDIYPIISSDYKLSINSILQKKNIKQHFSRFLQEIIAYSLTEFLLPLTKGGYNPAKLLLIENRKRLHRCEECQSLYISKRNNLSRFCSDKCRLALSNRKRIESGEAKEYKKKRYREEGKYKY